MFIRSILMSQVAACLKNILDRLQRLESRTGDFHVSAAAREEQLELGRELFDRFLALGLVPATRAELHSSFANKSPDQDLIKGIVAKLIRQKSWLEIFVCVYYETRIDFEYAVPARQVCSTRSGIQYLLDLFDRFDPTLDAALKSIRGRCEEDGGFDQQLKHWIENGYRMLNKQDVPSGVPAAHWWWF
jgi:hypothetical protein